MACRKSYSNMVEKVHVSASLLQVFGRKLVRSLSCVFYDLLLWKKYELHSWMLTLANNIDTHSRAMSSTFSRSDTKLLGLVAYKGWDEISRAIKKIVIAIPTPDVTLDCHNFEFVNNSLDPLRCNPSKYWRLWWTRLYANNITSYKMTAAK